MSGGRWQIRKSKDRLSRMKYFESLHGEFENGAAYFDFLEDFCWRNHNVLLDLDEEDRYRQWQMSKDLREKKHKLIQQMKTEDLTQAGRIGIETKYLLSMIQKFCQTQKENGNDIVKWNGNRKKLCLHVKGQVKSLEKINDDKLTDMMLDGTIFEHYVTMNTKGGVDHGR